MLRILVVLVLAVAVCASVVEVSSLHELQSLIGKTPNLAVEFYAPWCGHCKELGPHWKAAADELAAANIPVTLAMIDADAHKDAGQEFNVKGFPTIKFFRDGHASDYNGPRQTEGIVSCASVHAFRVATLCANESPVGTSNVLLLSMLLLPRQTAIGSAHRRRTRWLCCLLPTMMRSRIWLLRLGQRIDVAVSAVAEAFVPVALVFDIYFCLHSWIVSFALFPS
jgi:protein disulfide-isomerase-like protein